MNKATKLRKWLDVVIEKRKWLYENDKPTPEILLCAVSEEVQIVRGIETIAEELGVTLWESDVFQIDSNNYKYLYFYYRHTRIYQIEEEKENG